MFLCTLDIQNLFLFFYEFFFSNRLGCRSIPGTVLQLYPVIKPGKLSSPTSLCLKTEIYVSQLPRSMVQDCVPTGIHCPSTIHCLALLVRTRVFRSNRSLGAGQVKLFLERSTIRKLVRLPRPTGIGPVNLFDPSCSEVKSVKFANLGGRGPVNLFCCRSNLLNSGARISFGIGPVSSFT